MLVSRTRIRAAITEQQLPSRYKRRRGRGNVGLSFSRSVRFGAVRFNFSGSGIGVSAGIKGLRIGTGPRGAYISAGVGGFRYRTSLGGDRRTASSPSVPRPLAAPSGLPSAPPAMPDANVVQSMEHDTQSVLELTDSTSDALLESMNEQAKKVQLWPFAGAGLLLLFLWGRQFMESWPSWVVWVLFGIGAAATAWVRHRDHMKRLTVLFFEPDAQTTQAFTAVVEAAQKTSSINKLRSVLETSTYADSKYTAGAAQGLKFGRSSSVVGQAHGVLANVDVPVLTSGRTTLAFYPDRVLAFQGKSVGAISYANLNIESFPAQFIEHESVPGDATVVGHTWQYVNKKGGPDRRFKNNRQLPVCRYNRLHLSSGRGLDIRLMGSRDGAFNDFAHAIRQFAKLH